MNNTINIINDTDISIDIDYLKDVSDKSIEFLNNTNSAYEVGIKLVSNSEITKLNTEFLGRDYPTNVISFPYNLQQDEGIIYIGDIAISVEYALYNAKDKKIDINEVVAFYIVHGILHLFGYDHEGVNIFKKLKMKYMQNKLIKHLGLGAI